jgi:hypothetical protein
VDRAMRTRGEPQGLRQYCPNPWRGVSNLEAGLQARGLAACECEWFGWTVQPCDRRPQMTHFRNIAPPSQQTL